MSPSNKRYLCMYLPLWAVEMARYRWKKKHASIPAPLLLTGKSANQLLVKRCCLQAQHQGVRINMPLPLAQAMCPGAQTLPFDPYKDFQALRKLAVRALQFSPLVSMDSALLAAQRSKTLEDLDPLYNGILIDLTGTQRLHGSERELAEKIFSRFAKLSMSVRIGIAPTIGAAWAFSRFGTGSIHIAPLEKPIRETLADLPVEGLRLPAETRTALHALGIRSIESLLKLPVRQLGARFGTGLLQRLDQARGALEENFEAVQPPELLRALRRFEVPLTNVASISTALLHLFQLLFKELAVKRKKAGSFNIVLEGRDEERRPFQRSKLVSLNTTTRSFQHIAAVLDPLIQNLVIPGGLHVLTVIAYDVEHCHEEQTDFLTPADLHFLVQSGQEFLNSLVTRLGKEQVSLVHFEPSHIPERSFSYRALPSHYASATPPVCSTQPYGLGRPSYLFKQPQPITALSMLPDRPPVRLCWKGINLDVLQASGPERIAPEWWHLHRAPQNEREYFKVQDHLGRWLWVYRERRTMQWFVQGLWG